MSLTLVTAPTQDPVSLAEARAQCKVDVSDDDALIVGYLLAARQYVEIYTRRALITQTWDQVADELGSEIVLCKPPVQSVTSVKYLDEAGTEQTLASNQYRLISRDTGEAVIVPAYGVTWPTPQAVERAVTVRFVAGYGSGPSAMPETIRQAILLMVAHWYKNRETTAAQDLKEIPMGAESLLFPHRAF